MKTLEIVKRREIHAYSHGREMTRTAKFEDRGSESEGQVRQLDGAQAQGETCQMGATGLGTKNKEFFFW